MSRVSSPGNEVRVRSQRAQSIYISYIIKALGASTDGEAPAETFDSVTVRGMGHSISNVVNIAEVVKRRVRGLHQMTTISSETMPAGESEKDGEDARPDRKVSVLAIVLSKKPLDASKPGYQEPLPDDMVEAEDPEKRSRTRGTSRGRGGSRQRDEKAAYDAEKPEDAPERPPRGRGGRGRGASRGRASN